MSLINDMLKDLENRKDGKNPAEESPIVGLESQTGDNPEQPSGKPPGRKRLYILLGILAVLVIIVAWSYFSKRSKTSSQPNQATIAAQMKQAQAIIAAKAKETAKKSNESAAKAAEAAPQPASEFAKSGNLTGVQASVDGTKTKIVLNLSQLVHYKVHLASKSEFQLTLDNAKLESDMPILPDNAAISEIKTDTLHGDLVLNFGLQPETTLDTLTAQKENHTLTLVFDNPNSLVAETTASSSPANGAASAASEGPVKKIAVPLNPQEAANEKYQIALNLISQDNLSAAIDRLQAVVNYYPSFIEARETLVKLLLNNGNTQTAQNLLTRGLELTPSNSALIKLQARLYLNKGEPKLALSTLQGITAPSLQEDPGYYALTAALQQRLGQPMIAAQLYEQLLELEPSNSVWWMGLGISLESVSRDNAAIQAYRRAIATGNLNPNLRAFVAARLTKLGGR